MNGSEEGESDDLRRCCCGLCFIGSASLLRSHITTCLSKGIGSGLSLGPLQEASVSAHSLLTPPLDRHSLLQSEHSLRRVSKQQQHGSEISESIGIARPRRAPQLRGLGPEEIDAGLRPGDEH